jgi:hypothetical protein
MESLYEQYDLGNKSLNFQSSLIKLYDLNTESFPSILILDKNDNTKFALRKNLNIHTLNEIGKQLGSNLPISDIKELEIFQSYHKGDVINQLEIIRNPFSEACTDLLDIVLSKKTEFEITESSIDGLVSEHKEFENLQHPDRFLWKPSLKKYIRKHRDYLKVFIDKINMLESNPSSNGLNLKNIKNFTRINLTNSFRALYFNKGNQKEFFAYGEHDLGLRKFF